MNDFKFLYRYDFVSCNLEFVFTKIFIVIVYLFGLRPSKTITGNNLLERN